MSSHLMQSFASDATNRGFDSGKINQLFSKIQSTNNLEIEERSVKNIAQKLQLKLVNPQDMAVMHGTQIGYLFQWINRRQHEASAASLLGCLSVFSAIAKTNEGKIVLDELGAAAFFNDFYNGCGDSKQKEAIESIMSDLVGSNAGNTHATTLGNTLGNPFQTRAPANLTTNELSAFDPAQSANLANYSSVPVREQDPLHEEPSMQHTGTVSHSKRGGATVFNMTDFSIKKDAPQSQPHSQHQVSHRSSNSLASQNSQNPLHTAHMEILHKQQTLKEQCELPFVYLSEEDEKKLFDLSVQLKFGDFRTVMIALNTLTTNYIQDFPIEVLLQRADIFKSLLDLLEGGQGTGHGSASPGMAPYTNLAQTALVTFVRRLRNTYKFLTNNTNKRSTMTTQLSRYKKQQNADNNDCDESERANKLHSEYLHHSYPSTKSCVWNREEEVTDLRKYGALMPTEKLAAASTQGSLSCRAALGLILTKSIYLLKDTEKLGLYMQLIRETMSALVYIFQVERNPEFTELLHLCLFAFDSVCDFFKDQLLHEVLIQPIFELIVDFLSLLNSIPASQKERFKVPFSETFFKNSEKLQMTLRRGLFSLTQSDSTKHIILDFFERIETDLPQVNTLQKNVTGSYTKAKRVYQKFLKVHNFKITGHNGGTTFEDHCFVDSMPQMVSALDILEDLQECIEVKIEFPFEHLLLDCMVYSMIIAELKPHDNSRVDKIEALFLTFLSIPIPEVRERIIRRLYQRLRIIEAFQKATKHQSNNSHLLAKFVFRKKVLNQLVNGLLINSELASEETRLQMSLGQLLIRCLITAYNETGGLLSDRTGGLNSFLLTFQALLPTYPDIIGLVDLIEASAQRNCRYLRILRDVFSADTNKREFATSVLRSQFSRDAVSEHVGDLLGSVIDLRQPQLAVNQDFDLVNLNYDFTNFDIVNITSILQNAKSDYVIRKSSLEQLTLLLFDCAGKRGKVLFQNQGVQDVFSFVVDELLSAYNTDKTYLNEVVADLPPEHVAYLDQGLKFVFFAFVFFTEEEVVRKFFDRIRTFTQDKKSQSCEAQLQQFETFLNALTFFCGCRTLRQNAVRLLFVTVFSPVVMRVKVTKEAAHAWRSKREVAFVVPDFCQDTFLMIVPFHLQVIRMPLREDLLLSDEQKNLIFESFNQIQKSEQQRSILSQVGRRFVDSRQGKDSDFGVIMQNFDLLQNYLLAIGEASDELFSLEVLEQMQDVFRILPTRDFEFNFLADFLMGMTQTLNLSGNLRNKKQIENLVGALCEGLKFHFLPYLFEVGLSGLEQSLCEHHSPRVFFLQSFLEFLKTLATTDVMLTQQLRIPSRLQEKVLTSRLLNYLSLLFDFVKDRTDIQKQILGFFHSVIANYDTRGLHMDRIPDVLISATAQHRLSLNFEHSSLVITSLRSLLLVHQRRIAHLGAGKERVPHSGDLNATVTLSQTTQKYLAKFQTSGWLSRFTESRDARLRCLSWDLLTELFNFQFFKQNQSLCQHSINTILKDGELYCVKISALRFLNKLCDALIYNCDATQEKNEDMHDHLTDNRFVGSDAEHISVKTLLNSINKQGLISQTHAMLQQKDCPLLLVTQLLHLLQKLIQMDFRRSLPVLTQLDYWSILVDMIDIPALQAQDQSENRTVLNMLKDTMLREDPYIFDHAYMTVNTIFEFLFLAFKRDSQLAALLVKTTKLLPATFYLLEHTLDSVCTFREPNPTENTRIPIRNRGLLTLFVDKITKLLHICLLHPRDYSVDQIAKFLTARPVEDIDNKVPRNWLLLIKMFRLIGSQHSSFYHGHIDVKLQLCRFVAELLIRLPQSSVKNTFAILDETVRLFDGNKYMLMGHLECESEIDTYGGLLLLEFGKVFRALYVDDQRDSRQRTSIPQDLSECENSKIDICLCMSILLGSSLSAKTHAVSQNLVKKMIDICSENVEALHLAELQKFTQKQGQKQAHSQQMGSLSKQLFEQQFSRKLKYAVIGDLDLCEREVIRMLKVLKHLLFKSDTILLEKLSAEGKTAFLANASTATGITAQKSFVSQNAQTKITAKSKTKPQSLTERLMALFAAIMENLGGHSGAKQYEPILEECLMTMTNFASQNVKFKNQFMAACPAVLSHPKRNSVLKVVIDRLMSEPLHTNRKEMRLSFSLLRSLSVSNEVAKEVTRLHTIEDMHDLVAPLCKNEKDIKVLKNYLAQFTAFLAAFASTSEGQRTIMKNKQVYELSLFILDSVTPPSAAASTPEVSPTSQLLINILHFLRNTTNIRGNKLFFLADKAFMPCLLAFLSSRQHHPRVRGYASGLIWSILYNHQQVKANINTANIRDELKLLQSEYQRQCDISQYAHFINTHATRGEPEPTMIVNRSREQEEEANSRIELFTLLALNGVINTLEF